MSNFRRKKKLPSVGKTMVIVVVLCFCSARPFVGIAVAQKTTASDNSFSFVFMADIHVQPEDNASKGLLQAIDTVNKLKPDFVLTGGDNVMDASGQRYERADSLYRLFIETMKSLQAPYHTALGNHEFCRRGKDNSQLTPEHYKDMYRERLGETHYAFEHKSWHFIVLDSIMFGKGENYYYGRIDSAQMTWLRQVLESIGKEKPVAVTLHVPVLSIGYQIEEKGFTPRSVIKRENAQELLKLFKEYNVKLVLQGHLHMYEDILYRGTHYVTGGAVCSGWWRSKLHGMEPGFVLLTVNGENVSAKYMEFGWHFEEPKRETEKQ